MIAQSDTIMATLINEETESEMAVSSGHGDPELMGFTEVMYADERNRLFRRLETVIRRQMFIQDKLQRLNAARWRARDQRRAPENDQAAQVNIDHPEVPATWGHASRARCCSSSCSVEA